MVEMEGKRVSRYDHSFDHDRGELLMRFPCSMTKKRFIFLSTAGVILASIVTLLIMISVTIGILLIVDSMEDMRMFMGMDIALAVSVAIIVFLLSLTGFNDSIRGNEIRLRENGVVVNIKPQVNWPLISNFIPYKDIDSVSILDKKDRPKITILRTLVRHSLVYEESLLKGYFFHSLTNPKGILLLKMKEKRHIRYYRVGKLKKIVRSRRASFPIFDYDEYKYATDRIYIDVLPKYHKSFLKMVNKYKQDDLELTRQEKTKSQ